MLTLLAAQEHALVSGVSEQIVAATRELEREQRSVPQRAMRRDEVLAALAARWNVAPRTLSLASVVERAGDDGERLGRQRAELRELVAKVARLTRRNAFNARVQESVNAEILQTVLNLSGVESVAAGGALVDAEA
jgi:hypothetical protein